MVKAAAIFFVPVLLGETWVWASAAAAEAVTLIIIRVIHVAAADKKKTGAEKGE